MSLCWYMYSYVHAQRHPTRPAYVVTVVGRFATQRLTKENDLIKSDRRDRRGNMNSQETCNV